MIGLVLLHCSFSYIVVPNIPLRCSPVPRSESKNGLQQSPLRTPRSAENVKQAPAKALQRSKTMFVDRKSPLVPERVALGNGAIEKVNIFNGLYMYCVQAFCYSSHALLVLSMFDLFLGQNSRTILSFRLLARQILNCNLNAIIMRLICFSSLYFALNFEFICV